MRVALAVIVVLIGLVGAGAFQVGATYLLLWYTGVIQ